MQEEVRVQRCTHLAEERGGVGTDPHTVCTSGSFCRSYSQHSLWHEVLRRRRDSAQEQVLWHGEVEEAAQHLAAATTSQLLKFRMC